MLDPKLVLSNLVLHLSLVFFQVSEPLLKVNVLLSLGRHCLVKELSIMLNHRDNLFEIIVVKSFQVSLHRSDFRSVCFDQLLVLHEVQLGVSQGFLE